MSSHPVHPVMLSHVGEVLVDQHFAGFLLNVTVAHAELRHQLIVCLRLMVNQQLGQLRTLAVPEVLRGPAGGHVGVRLALFGGAGAAGVVVVVDGVARPLVKIWDRSSKMLM